MGPFRPCGVHAPYHLTSSFINKELPTQLALPSLWRWRGAKLSMSHWHSPCGQAFGGRLTSTFLGPRRCPRWAFSIWFLHISCFRAADAAAAPAAALAAANRAAAHAASTAAPVTSWCCQATTDSAAAHAAIAATAAAVASAIASAAAAAAACHFCPWSQLASASAIAVPACCS